MALCGWLCVSYNSLFLVSVHFEHSVQSGYPKNRAKSDRGENTTQTAKTPRPRAPSRATAQHARIRPTTRRDRHHLHHGGREPPEAGEPALRPRPGGPRPGPGDRGKKSQAYTTNRKQAGGRCR